MQNVYKIMEETSIVSNILYKKIDSIDLYLDVYFPAKKLGKEPWDETTKEKKPTLIYYHGGGWISGDKISRFLGLLPYLEKGWCVVNVDYRMLQKSNLIETLNDCIDAINWVHDNASKYKFDLNQIYLSGESAGGHLALLTGLVGHNNLENFPIQQRKSEAKGIINWYGITHMESAISFWDDSEYEEFILRKWQGDKRKYLEFTSPINHIHGSLNVPIITIHGNKDENVAIDQAISFHNKLDSIGVKNRLLEIEGKRHGDFSVNEFEHIFQNIWEFFEI